MKPSCWALLLGLVSSACDSQPPKSADGETRVGMSGRAVGADDEHHTVRVRLPNGDVAAGKEAFVALGCNSCHAVNGVDLPSPTVDPAGPVLGGIWPVAPEENKILSSILDPSRHIARYRSPDSTAAPTGGSRMPDFTRVMTVRQLADIAAFLHENYKPTSERGK